ncbi:LssY C-terminal domain-containing protein [Brachybacterium hainanense]|uniref:LssY C-terminal domain-containing protein n=1 Tax=Brachybacterium hainanense TaxID=1541174 RepID=A0ABV6RBJ9_9MICO
MPPHRPPRPVPLDRPVPDRPPVYDEARGHADRGRRLEIYHLLDALFVVAGLVISAWLAFLYLMQGFSLTPVRLLYLLVFWVLFTYITLPRLHQLLTWIYLPDYFFGRTRTTEGVLSDPINLAFDGEERDLHVAMRRAGWVLAEERTLRSAWSMILATVLRRSYPAAPVSDLYLLGRRHDFTYQQEVGGSTSKRHHVRFWRVPESFVLPGGYRVDWLAAGTYDRAVGFSAFTLQFTHRIDEDIDLERDYIVDTVRFADPACPVAVIDDFSTAYHDRNGQGDRLRTDGDLPIVDVTGAAARSAGASAVMLPRHRPMGISVLKPRAAAATQAALQAARSSASERPDLAGQWHDMVTDFRDVVAGAADHHLPPPTLLLTGLILLGQIAAVVLQWIALAVGVDLGDRIAEAGMLIPGRELLVTGTAFGVLAIVLYVLVLRRSRWARLGLIALFAADATSQLLVASSIPGDVAHSTLVAVGLSALGVMTMTSEAARLWVGTPRVHLTRSPRPSAG